MTKSVLFAALLGGLAVGCATDDETAISTGKTRIGQKGDIRVPSTAKVVATAKAGQPASFKATSPGSLILVDVTADRVLHTQRLETGQTFTFQPTAGRAAVNDQPVLAQDLSPTSTYQLYFNRDPQRKESGGR